MKARPLAAGICMLLISGPLAAQRPGGVEPDSLRARDLPLAVAEQVVERLNDPAATLVEGDTVFGSGVRHTGDLAVLDGDLSLAGSIEGNVLVVNGNVAFLPGGSISGDVLVVGGEVENPGAARVGGEITTYNQSFAYERVGGRIRYLLGPRPPGAESDRDGFADFLITTGKSYNRVEGMPIAFGPRLQTDSSNPLRIQALAIYRSESGLTLDPEQMGYFVRAEQYIAGRREYLVGAEFQSIVDPIEEWQLADLESGLATFLFHRDYRDHYERRGWTAFAAWRPRGSLHLLQLEARWERHGALATGSPWSLFRNAEDWRAQPLVAEGRLRSLVLRGEYDSRSSTWNPASGWLVRGYVEKALSDRLTYPAVVAIDPTDPEAPGDPAPVALEAPDYGRFLTGLIDLRSYNRVNAFSRLNLRVVAGGSLTGDPLPPQRQHALGGEGSLPGYPLFAFDCGARSGLVAFASDVASGIDRRFHPQYGCDAFGLLQAEFRGKLSFRFRWDEAPWRDGADGSDRVWDFGWDMAPDWALFVDVGRGWTFHDRADEQTRVDVGGGLLLDRFGVYLAVPVTGGSGANLFVRLGPRF